LIFLGFNIIAFKSNHMHNEILEKKFNLRNRVAVVTGGLGMLGTEYVKALTEVGAKVAVLDIKKPDKNHELADLKFRQKVKFYQTDITDREKIKKVLQSIKKSWTVPAVLINNAACDFIPGVSKGESFEDYPLKQWEAVLAVNLTGMLICCQIFGQAMAEKKRGSIINISSTYGLVSPDQRIYTNFIKPVSYSVTKSGVLNLTRYLATYWAEKNVRVNTLTPGGVFNSQNPDFVKKYSYKTPLGRMARKDEYNGAILFLASDASSYMTGANLVIDGGWTAW